MAAAGQAPSPDNNQPWSFSVAGDAIHVFHRRSRAIRSDVQDMFSGLALGAAIENLVLEASRWHRKAEVEYVSLPLARGPEFEPVATVRCIDSCVADPLAEQIETRVTNRRHYSRAPLRDYEIQALTDSVDDADCQVSWLTGRAALRRIARLVYEADRIRFEHRAFHDELHSVLRLDRDAALAGRDGLEFSTLELPALARPLLRWLKPWPRMDRLNRLGLSRAFARNSISQVARSAAVGVLTSERCDTLGFVQAGRQFQRIWLAATSLNIALQPLGALPLFLRRLDVLGEQSFAPQHARRLAEVEGAFAQLVAKPPRAVPVMMFRVGHCGPPSGRSLRFTVDQIMRA
ncbi:MAG: hypothetical protein ACT4QC_06090 [Planctomycetaceae bacterium]